LEKRVKLREIETIISTDLLELLVLCIIMQQYTLQCTIQRDSSATLPLPSDQHHISFWLVSNKDVYKAVRERETFHKA